MMMRTLAALLAGLSVWGTDVMAQPYDPGPAGTIPGSSMAGKVRGAPQPGGSRAIPNADVFGDEFEERAFGRDYDDSYLRPRVRQGIRSGRSNEERATEGRSGLGTINAGEFARQGPRAIGRSSVTRSGGFSRGGRARIVVPQR